MLSSGAGEGYRRIVASSIGDLSSALSLPTFPQILAELVSGPIPEDWSMEPEALAVVLAYVDDLRPHTTVELGTYRGSAATAIARRVAKYGGRLYSVDNGPEEHAAEARARLTQERLLDTVTLLRTSTVDAFVDWGRERVDCLIIDAAHHFAAACIDIGLWSRLVSPDGIIFIHDTVTRLARRFPVDYIFPLSIYDVTDIVSLNERPSNHSWEGLAIVRFTSEFRAYLLAQGWA